MEKFTLNGGADLYLNKSDKFKTWSVTIHIYRPLNDKEASYNSVLAKVLKSSTAKYSSLIELSKKLDLMYGTGLAAGVRKYSNAHGIYITLTAVCDKFLPAPITKDVLKLAYDIVFSPDILNNSFKKDIVELEKNNLKKQIESYINDKTYYADKRCLEALCEGDSYKTDINGSVEEIDKITAESLYEHYLDVIETSKKEIYLCGNIDLGEAKEIFGDVTSKDFESGVTACKKAENVKEITDEMDVTQGKLVMGFKTTVTENENRPLMMVFNAVFGGSATSKLFNNVREKLSLAYYANTRMYFAKGIIMARAGIEISNFDKAKTEIENQLCEIQKGNITDDELQNAISHLVNVYSSLSDDPQSEVSLKSSWLLENETRDSSEIVEEIKKVTKEQIIDVSKSLTLDTVYFLKDKEE